MASEPKSRLTAFKNKGKDQDEMRRRRNEVSVELRKNKREETLQKRRNVLLEEDPVGENMPGGSQLVSPLVTSTTAGDTAGDTAALLEILARAASDDLAVRLAGVQAARKLLSAASAPPIDQLLQLDILTPLINCLPLDDHADLQFEAAWALTNLASGTSEHTNMVVSAGTVPHFLRLLQSPHPQVCEQAVWALGNIIGDSVQLRDYVLSLGALPPLLALLNSAATAAPATADAPATDADEIQLGFLRNITWVLVNVCRHNSPPPPLSVVAALLPVLEPLLCHRDAAVLADAVWMLSFITEAGRQQVQLVVEQPRVLSLLVPHLAHTDRKVQAAALRAVGNIVTGDDEQTQAILDHNALTYFPQLLQSHSSKITKEAAWFLSNITAGNSAQVQAVFDHNLLPLIVQLLRTADFQVQRECAWCVSNITVKGSASHVLLAVEAGVVPLLCRLLGCHEQRLVRVLLEAIANILGHRQLPAAVQQLVLSAIEECGGLDTIERLQTHQNQDIYQLAYDLLERYFPDQSETEAELNSLVQFDF